MCVCVSVCVCMCMYVCVCVYVCVYVCVCVCVYVVPRPADWALCPLYNEGSSLSERRVILLSSVHAVTEPIDNASSLLALLGRPADYDCRLHCAVVVGLG